MGGLRLRVGGTGRPLRVMGSDLILLLLLTITAAGFVFGAVLELLNLRSARPDIPDEVAAIYRVPLWQIAAEDAAIFLTIPESERPVIRLAVRDRHIHAPTAALLYQFAELLHGRVTRVDQLEQPVFAWK